MNTFTRWLGRKWWDTQRFGLLPPKAFHRLRPARDLPRLLLVSIPKSGTHLIERALCLHPRIYRPVYPTLTQHNLPRYGGLDRLLGRLKPGQLLVSHLPFRSEFQEAFDRHGIQALFIVRDPRDTLVSNAHYIFTQPRHHLHPFYKDRVELKDRIRLGIEGIPSLVGSSLEEHLQAFLPWARTLPTLRFEDFAVRSDGSKLATAPIHELYQAAGIELDERTASHIAAKLHSSASPTFRKGRSGQGRELFDAELTDCYERHAGAASEQLGYPAASGPLKT